MITILNTSIITSDGLFQLKPITLEQAKSLIDIQGFQSAVGHQSTADILTELLEVDVSMNRIMFKQTPGQALVFKLNGRPEEGKILTKGEIEEIGYSFKLLTRFDTDRLSDLYEGVFHQVRGLGDQVDPDVDNTLRCVFA